MSPRLANVQAMPIDVWARFQETAEAQGSRTALRVGAVQVSFSELARSAAARASTLERLGIRAGDVVAVVSHSPVGFVTGVLATWAVSAVPLLAAASLGRQELRGIATGVADWLVTDEGTTAERIAEAVGGALVAEDSLFAAAGGGQGLPREAGLGLVKLSSGSTAELKTVALTGDAVLAEAGSVCDVLSLSDSDTVLCPVPVHHSYGFDLGVLPMLAVGSTLQVHAPLVPPRLLDELQGADISVLLGIPGLYRALVDAPLAESHDLSHLRFPLSCTAPLAPELVGAFSDRFAVPICQHYGASEAGGVTTHVPSEALRLPSSVGRAMTGVRIEIEDGEVVVSGPALAVGYLSGAPNGLSPLRDGRFHTGDLGSLDEDGFLTLGGRRDALVNVGGLKVSPLEVQWALERHPAVRDAGVLGRDDGSGGRYVHAVVALAGDATERELIAHCRRELAEHKVPRRIEFREALPRTTSGKIRLRDEDVPG